MEFYTSFTSSNAEEDDEHYHCSPAVNAEDIICGGSDTEETAEETLVKRTRYEEQARRYIQGHLPVLQSASLRGPFDRSTGWENPWQYRPRKRDDWWQREPEEIPFSRKDVIRRAAAHGLRQLSATEALVWDKKAAKAEAEAMDGCVLRSTELPGELETLYHEMDVEANDEDRIGGFTQAGLSDEKVLTNCKRHSDFLRTETYSMTSDHQSNITNIGGKMGNCARAMKRSAAAQWLKGSYVSKRARWDGPAIASPTPLPDIRGDNGRPCPPRFADSSRSRPTSLRKPAREGPRAVRSTTEHFRHPLMAHSSSDNYEDPSESSDKRPRKQAEDFNEPGEQSVSAISFQYGSSIKPPKSPPKHGYGGHQQEVNGIKEHHYENPQHSVSAISFQWGSSIKPQHPQSELEEDSDPVEEISFITVVAPSCRDLEKFQYRKKRRISPQDPEYSKLDCLKPHNKIQCSPSRPILSAQNIIYGNQLRSASSRKVKSGVTPERAKLGRDDGDYVVPAKDIAPELSLSPVDDSSPKLAIQLVENSTTPSISGKLGASWDLRNDVHQNSSFKHAVNSEPAISRSPRSISPDNQDITIVPSLTDIPNPGTNIQYPSLSPRPDHLVHLRSSTQRPQKIPVLDPEFEMTPKFDENSVDTQSSNTRPIRSPNNLIELSSPPIEARGTYPSNVVASMGNREVSPDEIIQNYIKIKDGETYGEEAQGVMDDIQKELSQNYPNINCDDGSQNYSSHNSEDDINVDDIEIEELKSVDTVLTKEYTAKPASSGHFSHENIDEKFSDTNYLMGSLSDREETPKHMVICLEDISNVEDADLTDNESPEPGKETATTDSLSEGSRQGCGLQSPWGTENFQPLPMSEPKQEYTDHIFSNVDSEREASAETDESSIPGGLGWETFERPGTPESDVIRPFENFRTPTSSSGRKTVQIGADSVQQFVNAAIRNPWTSSLRRPKARKPNKRVSFGVLPTVESDYLCKDIETPVRPRQSPGSPPPPDTWKLLGDGDISCDGNTTINKFQSHFTAARQFKRILPDKRASQLDSSPAAIDAMAEAFISADREVSSEPEGQTSLDGSPKNFHAKHEIPLDSFSVQSEPTSINAMTASFDMDAALCEAGDFLGDWSVEADFKRAKRTETERDRKSNSMRRSKFLELM